MVAFTPKILSLILTGIILFSFYFNAKFKTFIGFSFICFLLATLKLFKPDAIGLHIVTVLFTLLVVLIMCLVELQNFRRKGKKIFRPTGKTLVFALLLSGVYVLFKIFYFDK